MPRTPAPQPRQTAETLRERLARPANFNTADDVARPTLQMLAPEYAKLAGHVVRERLFQLSADFVLGMAGVQLPYTMPKNHIPDQLVLQRPPNPAGGLEFFPSHAIAVAEPFTPLTPPGAPVTLVAMHGAVFAAHCSRMTLPRPHPQVDPTTIRLPVVHLTVPSLPAFVILRAYMYSRRVDNLLTGLGPFPPAFLSELRGGDISARLKAAQTGTELDQIRRAIMFNTDNGLDFGGTTALWTRVRFLQTFWQTMIHLVMTDSLLWDAFDFAWFTMRNALRVAASYVPSKHLQESWDQERKSRAAQERRA